MISLSLGWGNCYINRINFLSHYRKAAKTAKACITGGLAAQIPHWVPLRLSALARVIAG